MLRELLNGDFKGFFTRLLCSVLCFVYLQTNFNMRKEFCPNCFNFNCSGPAHPLPPLKVKCR